MSKKHNRFFNDLSKAASLLKCRLIGIPDERVTPESLKRWKDPYKRPKRRPFDCLLVTPSGNYCLELKVNNDSQSFHQKTTEHNINRINKSYYVVRKREGFPSTYSLHQPGKWLPKTTKIEEIIQYFKEDKNGK